MGRRQGQKPRRARKLIIWAFLVLTLLAVSWSALIAIIGFSSARYITDDPSKVPKAPLAIVFGAGVRDGIPSTILRYRLDGAINLYRRGVVNKLLMSGDNRTADYNEPKVMKKYALAQKVPERDILVDFAGRDTYDTCFRAKEVFGIDRAILVTQGYHMPRAVYLSRSMGIEASGFAVPNLSGYEGTRAGYVLREACADLKAVWDLNVLHRRPYVDLGGRKDL